MAGIGIPELIIVLVILLVVFGPKRLPGIGRSLGSGMREFKDSVTGNSKDDDDRPSLPAATSQSTQTTSPAPEPVAAPTPPPAEPQVPSEQSRA